MQDGIAYSPGPYVLASSLRYCRRMRQLRPISSDQPDKKIVVDLVKQEMTCFEGDTPVFSPRTATGYTPHYTPRGEYQVIRKHYTSYMIGGEGADHYDLPGVAFPSYFTPSGIAVHGTYWHNDYGRPRSHGCVNVSNDAAQFRLSLDNARGALRSGQPRRQTRAKARKSSSFNDAVTLGSNT